MDPAKFKQMSGSMQQAFGVQTEVTATDPPKGTSLDAKEFSPAVPEPTDQHEVRQHTVDSDLNTLDLGLQQRLRELKAQEEAADQQAQQLRAIFRQEIDDGKLLIRQEGTNVTIQLLEKDSFPSGSANLETSSVDTLAKVGSSRQRDDRRDHGVRPHGQRAGPAGRHLSLELGSIGRARGVGRARTARCRSRPDPPDGDRPRGHAAASGERLAGEPRAESARGHHVREWPRSAEPLGRRGACAAARSESRSRPSRTATGRDHSANRAAAPASSAMSCWNAGSPSSVPEPRNVTRGEP